MSYFQVTNGCPDVPDVLEWLLYYAGVLVQATRGLMPVWAEGLLWQEMRFRASFSLYYATLNNITT